MKENLPNFVEELDKLKTWDAVAAYFMTPSHELY